MSDLELRCEGTLRGPNIWARVPVVEVRLSLDARQILAPAVFSGFCERVCTALAAAPRHAELAARVSRSLTAVQDEDALAQALAQLIVTVQALAGTQVSFSRCVSTAERGVYRLFIEVEEAALAQPCVAFAEALCRAALRQQPFDVVAEIKGLRDVADQVCLGPSTHAIAQAARQRGIPLRRLNTGSLVQLGQGRQQHRICAAETDRTGAIAEMVACDKELTKQLLRAAGVPVPEGRLAADAEDAWKAAQELGAPAVVKPLNGNHGRSVFIGLTEREEITAAYEVAQSEGDGVIVERYISGAEHRLLVVGAELVAATRGDPFYVVGDGRRSIAELVAELNRDPRRGRDSELPLNPVRFDSPNEAIVAHQGYTRESIPPRDARILVQPNGNLSNDVTDLVHPATAATAVLAAKMVGLDVAGVDIVADDISRPLHEQGGAVVEVNAGPGLQMHLQPATGQPRPVGEKIIASLFPEHATGRVPLLAICGGPNPTGLAKLLARLLWSSGIHTGLACADGVFVDGKQQGWGDATSATRAADLLLHPLIDAAVFEVSKPDVRSAGLGFDVCQFVVVADAEGPPAAGQIAEVDAVERVLVESLPSSGWAVLPAASPLASGVAGNRAERVILTAENADHAAVVAQRQSGGRVVFLRGAAVVLAAGSQEAASIPLAELTPAVALPAVAAAWAWGLTPADIASGLKS